MKPPKKLRIGPYTFRVENDKEWTDERNVWGQIVYNPQLIKIAPDTTPERQRVTILHECLHAIHHLVGFPDPGAEDAEEQVVSRSSPFIVQLLRDNPKLVTYLLAKD